MLVVSQPDIDNDIIGESDSEGVGVIAGQVFKIHLAGIIHAGIFPVIDEQRVFAAIGKPPLNASARGIYLFRKQEELVIWGYTVGCREIFYLMAIVQHFHIIQAKAERCALDSLILRQ